MSDYFKDCTDAGTGAIVPVTGVQVIKTGARAHYHNLGIKGTGSFSLAVKLKGGAETYDLGTVINKSESDAPFEFTGLIAEVIITPDSVEPFIYEISGG